VRLWHAATGAELLCFKDLPAAVNCVGFSRDGALLAAALHNGNVACMAGAAGTADPATVPD